MARTEAITEATDPFQTCPDWSGTNEGLLIAGGNDRFKIMIDQSLCKNEKDGKLYSLIPVSLQLHFIQEQAAGIGTQRDCERGGHGWGADPSVCETDTPQKWTTIFIKSSNSSLLTIENDPLIGFRQESRKVALKTRLNSD
jgi:hypothetical protein